VSSEAHIWGSSAVAVLDTVVAKFARHGTTAEIIGLNEASTAIHDRLSGHMQSGH
jgi:sulfate permease, SulP family